MSGALKVRIASAGAMVATGLCALAHTAIDGWNAHCALCTMIAALWMLVVATDSLGGLVRMRSAGKKV